MAYSNKQTKKNEEKRLELWRTTKQKNCELDGAEKKKDIFLSLIQLII